jgi:large subunit ribosomal protein L21
MYAIVDISGKQFKVQKDTTLYVPRQQAEVGDTLTFDRVLLVSGDDVQVGAPTVSGASVTAKVLGHLKGDKVIVFKKKRRKGYRVKNGHRQPFTKVSIDALNVNGSDDN